MHHHTEEKKLCRVNRIPINIYVFELSHIYQYNEYPDSRTFFALVSSIQGKGVRLRGRRIANADVTESGARIRKSLYIIH